MCQVHWTWTLNQTLDLASHTETATVEVIDGTKWRLVVCCYVSWINVELGGTCSTNVHCAAVVINKTDIVVVDWPDSSIVSTHARSGDIVSGFQSGTFVCVWVNVVLLSRLRYHTIMKLSSDQDPVRSWDKFTNGCIPMHCDGRVSGDVTVRLIVPVVVVTWTANCDRLSCNLPLMTWNLVIRRLCFCCQSVASFIGNLGTVVVWFIVDLGTVVVWFLFSVWYIALIHKNFSYMAKCAAVLTLLS